MTALLQEILDFLLSHEVDNDSGCISCHYPYNTHAGDCELKALVAKIKDALAKKGL